MVGIPRNQGTYQGYILRRGAFERCHLDRRPIQPGEAPRFRARRQRRAFLRALVAPREVRRLEGWPGGSPDCRDDVGGLGGKQGKLALGDPLRRSHYSRPDRAAPDRRPTRPERASQADGGH